MKDLQAVRQLLDSMGAVDETERLRSVHALPALRASIAVTSAARGRAQPRVPHGTTTIWPAGLAGVQDEGVAQLADGLAGQLGGAGRPPGDKLHGLARRYTDECGSCAHLGREPGPGEKP